MRRSASQVIRNLEMRIARLERQSGNSSKVKKFFEKAIIGRMNDENIYQFRMKNKSEDGVLRFMNDAKPYIRDKILVIKRDGLEIVIKRGINFPSEW